MTKDKLQSSIKTTHSNPENNQITFYITFIIIIIIINVDVGPVCAHFD
jgi:t-SNARE complex subunit (syntaxin)